MYRFVRSTRIPFFNGVSVSVDEKGAVKYVLFLFREQRYYPAVTFYLNIV